MRWSLVPEREDLHLVVGLSASHFASEGGEVVIPGDLLELLRPILEQDWALAQIVRVQVGALIISLSLWLLFEGRGMNPSGQGRRGQGSCVMSPRRYAC